MKKYCDNCLRELSKFSFLHHDKKKIYRYNQRDALSYLLSRDKLTQSTVRGRIIIEDKFFLFLASNVLGIINNELWPIIAEAFL